MGWTGLKYYLGIKSDTGILGNLNDGLSLSRMDQIMDGVKEFAGP